MTPHTITIAARALLLAGLLAGLLPLARADDDLARRQALAGELATLLDIETMMAGMREPIEAMIRSQVEGALDCPAARPVIDRYAREAGAVVADGLANDALVGDIVAIYVELFDAAELAGLVEFYRSPLGRKLIERMPQVMARSMALGQQFSESVLARVQPLAEQFGRDVASARLRCNEKSAKR